MNIRALVFDVFGTVVDWRSGVARDIRRLVPEVDAEAFADAWRSQYLPSLDRVRRGELPWTNLDELHRASLDELLAEYGVPDTPEGVRAELVLAWHRLDPWPDSVPGMERLKKRFVIASLSNGHVALLVNMAKHAGLPWDTVLSAELFEHYKGDPEAYLGAARLLGLQPEEVMMVAAHVDDLAAARACGLRTAYVHRPQEFGSKAALRPPSTDPKADVSVASLTELADHLTD
ncbi:haloacid dehalogenase type II [Streptomyces sp. NPDC047061]|uniref:haloacid dehalogenase type II n=1 Tax=Streptomyces sp. NPDC047061 TaxID=3154605 RepID=UPI0033F2DB64